MFGGTGGGIPGLPPFCMIPWISMCVCVRMYISVCSCMYVHTYVYMEVLQYMCSAIQLVVKPSHLCKRPDH